MAYYACLVMTGPTNVDQRVSLEGLANRSSADVRGVQASVYKASRWLQTIPALAAIESLPSSLPSHPTPPPPWVRSSRCFGGKAGSRVLIGATYFRPIGFLVGGVCEVDPFLFSAASMKRCRMTVNWFGGRFSYIRSRRREPPFTIR